MQANNWLLQANNWLLQPSNPISEPSTRLAQSNKLAFTGAQLDRAAKQSGRIVKQRILSPAGDALTLAGVVLASTGGSPQPAKTVLPAEFLFNYDGGMDDRTRNTLSMGRTVQTYLADNNSVWSDVPAIGTAVTQLDAKLDDIEGTTEQQETPIEGSTQDKETLRDQLEEKTLFIASAVFSWAVSQNNNDLAAEVDFTLTQLDRMAEQELANAALRTHTRATENFAAIKSDYKLAQADLDSLNTTLTAFSEKMPQPRAKISARAGITQTIPGKRKDLMSFLRQVLDRLMVRYRTINPQFYGGYQSARVIVDLKAKQPPKPPPP